MAPDYSESFEEPGSGKENLLEYELVQRPLETSTEAVAALSDVRARDIMTSKIVLSLSEGTKSQLFDQIIYATPGQSPFEAAMPVLRALITQLNVAPQDSAGHLRAAFHAAFGRPWNHSA